MLYVIILKIQNIDFLLVIYDDNLHMTNKIISIWKKNQKLQT